MPLVIRWMRIRERQIETIHILYDNKVSENVYNNEEIRKQIRKKTLLNIDKVKE